jgi:restriction system protein
MAYGGSRYDAAQAIGKSGDEGLDGIIKEDRLGLDIIYVQAKRWVATVGRPEIQKFTSNRYSF